MAAAEPERTPTAEPPPDEAETARRIARLLSANGAASRHDPEGWQPDVTWTPVELPRG